MSRDRHVPAPRGQCRRPGRVPVASSPCRSGVSRDRHVPARRGQCRTPGRVPVASSPCRSGVSRDRHVPARRGQCRRPEWFSVAAHAAPTNSRAATIAWRAADNAAGPDGSVVAAYAAPTGSQPASVPERVIADLVDQTRTYRVHDQIACGGQQIVLGAHGAIMECAGPHRAQTRKFCPHLSGRIALQPADGPGQIAICADLDQAMPMVRHQHPRQELRIRPYPPIRYGPARCHRQIAVPEQWPPAPGDESHEIDMVG